jgi:hypothetical protein
VSDDIEALRQQLTALESRLAEKIGTISGRVADHDVLFADQEATAAKVDQVSELVADLVVKVGLDKTKSGKKLPYPTTRWWLLTDEEKAAQVGRLRGWVDQIARPWLGAGRMAQCVYLHNYALTLLDAAEAAWRSLWIPERRTPEIAAAQCEYLTRIWPAIRAEITRETSQCDHQVSAYPRAVSS